MAKITHLERFPISTPTNIPFTMSSGTYLAKDKVIVRVHTDAGIAGVGEAMAIPTFSEETQESVLGAIDRYLGPAIVGLDVSNFAILHQAMEDIMIF